MLLFLYSAALASDTDTGSTEEPEQKVPLTVKDGGEGHCVITIVRVIEAAEYRGSGPMTPDLQDQLAADPGFAEMYFEEGHGDHHILCRYEVRLGSAPDSAYEWQEYHANTARKLTGEICYEEPQRVAQHILSSTKGCSDLDAGAYWGFALRRLR